MARPSERNIAWYWPRFSLRTLLLLIVTFCGLVLAPLAVLFRKLRVPLPRSATAWPVLRRQETPLCTTEPQAGDGVHVSPAWEVEDGYRRQFPLLTNMARPKLAACAV